MQTPSPIRRAHPPPPMQTTPVNRQTCVKTLPGPKLRLRDVNINILILASKPITTRQQIKIYLNVTCVCNHNQPDVCGTEMRVEVSVSSFHI